MFFRRVNEYSPAESAKVTDKPIARQQKPIFRPDLTLTELKPEVIARRDTVEGHINLCEQLVNVSFNLITDASSIDVEYIFDVYTNVYFCSRILEFSFSHSVSIITLFFC